MEEIAEHPGQEREGSRGRAEEEIGECVRADAITDAES